MMEAFRKALGTLGFSVAKWHGPGVVAEEVLRQKGIIPKKAKKGNSVIKFGLSSLYGKMAQEGHYPEFLTATKRTVAQDWNHHCFSGGRIELIRQGVHADPANPIYQYDICSAYPAVIKDLPSMRGGKYKKHKAQSMTLEQFKTFANGMNSLSMFEVDWALNEGAERTLSSEEVNALLKTCTGKTYSVVSVIL